MGPVVQFLCSTTFISLEFFVGALFEWCSPMSWLSEVPDVFDGISFPRPSTPVVSAGSPHLVSELVPLDA